MTAYPFSNLSTAFPAEAAAARPRAASGVEYPSLFGRHLLRLPRFVWMSLDAALVAGGALLGHWLLLLASNRGSFFGGAELHTAIAVHAAALVIAGVMFGLYEPQTLWQRSRIVARSLLTVVVAALLAATVLRLMTVSTAGRRVVIAGTLFYLPAGPLVRMAAHALVTTVRRGLLFVGSGRTTAQVIRAIRRGAVPGYRFVGVVAESDAPLPEMRCTLRVGSPADVERLCREHDIREVVVARGEDGAIAHPDAALACLRLGCRVTDEVTFFEKAFGEVPTSHIAPHWFLLADLTGHLQEHATLKRCFDLVAASGVLLLSLPLWPFIIFAVRCSGPGPIFYAQTRVGQGGRLFRLHKFRTMRADAESNGSVWAATNDPRVTWTGRLLRRSRLDELPQLWNILRGDMSVVGPRPERPEFVGPLSRLIPFFSERLLIKPGLTGWAQINFRYGNSIADARKKLQLDLYYIKHMSIELDLVILLRTVGLLVTDSA